MNHSHTLHLLNIEPNDRLEWAMEYVRILDFYNIHADNLMSFVGSFSHVPASDVDKFAQHSIVRSVALQMGEEHEAVAKYNWEQAFVAIAQHGLSPAESNELERLMTLLDEHAIILGDVEREALEDASLVSFGLRAKLEDDPECIEALEVVNKLACSLFFFMIGEEDKPKEDKERLAQGIRAYHAAVRSGVFDDIFISKADMYSMGAVISSMNDIGLGMLKNWLDDYAGAALELAEVEAEFREDNAG